MALNKDLYNGVVCYRSFSNIEKSLLLPHLILRILLTV